MELVMNFLYSLHFHPVVFFVQLILFLVFHYGMKAIIYDPLIAARNDREGRIQGQLAKAEAAAANAQALKSRYDEELKSHRQVLAQELKDAIDSATTEANAKVQAARDEAGRISEDASRKLDEERRQLEAGMGAQAQQLALAVAEKVVRNSLDEGAQDRVLARLKG